MHISFSIVNILVVGLVPWSWSSQTH